MEPWIPHFAASAPLQSSFGTVAPLFAGEGWPALSLLQQAVRQAGLHTASGLPLQLVPPGNSSDDLGYEMRLHLRGELECREHNWHDFFNALVWLAFPRAKAALNARHAQVLAASRGAAGPGRGAVRDALTLFDESGVIVLSADAGLLQLLRDFQWRTLFWTRRADVMRNMRFVLFGHALCEKMLKPYKGITGHGLLLDVDREFLELPPPAQLVQMDARITAQLTDPRGLQRTAQLAPVPVLGVPGWCADNEAAAYYDDQAYFRPGRRRDRMPRHETVVVK